MHLPAVCCCGLCAAGRASGCCGGCFGLQLQLSGQRQVVTCLNQLWLQLQRLQIGAGGGLVAAKLHQAVATVVVGGGIRQAGKVVMCQLVVTGMVGGNTEPGRILQLL